METKNKKITVVLLFAVFFMSMFAACSNYPAEQEDVRAIELARLVAQPSREILAGMFSEVGGFPQTLADSWKVWGFSNPLITQAFGADPNIIIFEDRLFIYASNDTIEYTDLSGTAFVSAPSYQWGIQGIRMISTIDMVNWTDHGVANIVGTPNTNRLILPEYWIPAGTFRHPPTPGYPEGRLVTRSWAPTAAWTMFAGSPRFFLYWGDGGDGVGVVMADTPIGPWRSPLGHRLLVDRSTPGNEGVAWLFDPSVFVDESGQGYIFLGGGMPFPDPNFTTMARRARLTPSMVSLAEPLQQWHVPYLFEAIEMKRIRGRYYLSWSTHYQTAGNPYGLVNFEIAYQMSETSPMDIYPGGFTPPRGMMRTASTTLGTTDSNNHHAMFEFRGETFITYHAQLVSMAKNVYSHLEPPNHRLRSSMIDYMPVNEDGSIPPVIMTRQGVGQMGYLDPFILQEAETIAVQGGIYTRPATGASNGKVVTSIDAGDWLGVYGVDFGEAGATRFMARVRTPVMPGQIGAIELRLNPQTIGPANVLDGIANITIDNTVTIIGGEVIGAARIQAVHGQEGQFARLYIELDRLVTGVHDLVFVFYCERGPMRELALPDTRHMDSFEFDQWQFFH